MAIHAVFCIGAIFWARYSLQAGVLSLIVSEGVRVIANSYLVAKHRIQQEIEAEKKKQQDESRQQLRDLRVELQGTIAWLDSAIERETNQQLLEDQNAQQLQLGMQRGVRGRSSH
jgi:hypothetical protein